jgi:type II secretory pathway pseudopilin PulG
LLVVIAVIAILAALFFPMVSAARTKAQVAADLNALQQIGTLLSLFSGDNNGNFPVQGETTPYNFPEALDRYLPPVTGFNSGSAYNFQRRSPVLWVSPASAQPFAGWNRQASFPSLTGPWAFGWNGNLANNNWRGYMARVPNRARTVAVGCINEQGNHNINPDLPAAFEPNTRTRYRVSYPGKTSLYLFCDLHVEQLVGDRGTAYFKDRPNEPNMWRWW